MAKRVLVLLAGGFTAGVLLSFWFGPPLVAWFSIPLGMDAQPNVPFATIGALRAALNSLVVVELATGLTFAVLTAVVGVLVARRRAAKAASTPGATPPTAAA